MTAYRPDWDSYFYEIAKVVSTRSSCPRAQCGAVIVSPRNRILATGYNGSAPGEPHCFEEGCLMEDGHCQRTLHAEVNAIAHAPMGLLIDDARMYIYRNNIISVGVGSCRECRKVLKAAGIQIHGDV